MAEPENRSLISRVADVLEWFTVAALLLALCVGIYGVVALW